MSHVSYIQLLVKSLQNLETAAANLGLVFQQQDTYRWWGQYMGDYAMPEGLTKEDLGKCDYALSIPGKGLAYEVGVRAMPDGSYRLLWDFYNGGYGLQEKIGEDGCKLISEYEAVTYKSVMAAEGYEINEVILSDGSREITATQY